MGKDHSKMSVQRPQDASNKSLTALRSIRNKNHASRRFFIFGIDAGNVEKFFEFHPLTETFEILPSPKKMKLFNYMAAITVEDVIYLTGGINKELNSIQKLCYCFNINSNDVEKLPDMNQYRYTHMSIVNGKRLYVFGGRTYGFGEAGILSHCEYLDLNSKKWVVISPMRKKRCTGFTFIYKNNVYVMGGYTGDKKRSKKIECYLAEQNIWHYIELKLNHGVECGTILAGYKDEFIICGGNIKSGASDVVYSYNLQKNTKVLLSPLGKKRVLQKTFEWEDQDTVYIFGGEDQKSCEKAIRGEWIWKTFSTNLNVLITDNSKAFSYTQYPLEIQNFENSDERGPVKLDNHLRVHENTRYLFGTDEEAFIFEVNLSKLTVRSLQLKEPLKLYCYQGGAPLVDGKFILCGGVTSSMTKISNEVYIYNAVEHWSVRVKNMIQLRYTFNCAYKNGFVYAIGGRMYGTDDVAVIASCERFNLEKDTWEEIAPLNIRRCSAMSLVFKNMLYISGGYNGKVEREKSFEIYDDNLNKWFIMGIELKYPVEAGLLIMDEPNIIYVGGRDSTGDSQRITTYDVEHGFDSFYIKDEADMREKRCLHKGAKIDEDIFIIIGGKSWDTAVEFLQYENGVIKVASPSNLQTFRKELISSLKDGGLKQSSLQKYTFI